MSRQAQNIKPVQDANTPPNVIANTARFNTQFNNTDRQSYYCEYTQIVDRNGRAR